MPMLSESLQKKIDRAIKLLQAYNDPNNPVEIAYSGGKDSDVILQLAKESGINFRAIYKNTTIDPAGTISHVKAMGVEVLRPRDGLTFFKLIEKNGFPNMFARHCCRYLKEYKVLDKAVIGVRKSESRARASRYTEPTQCRFFGSKKEHVEQIMPILEWTDQDVKEFLQNRNVKCAPVYYDEDGNFHVERRLGCMCCPLASGKKRIAQFIAHPRMVKAYCRAGQKFLEQHPNTKTAKRYKDVYEWFVRDLFYDSEKKWQEHKTNMFDHKRRFDYKKHLEDYFNIKFNQ